MSLDVGLYRKKYVSYDMLNFHEEKEEIYHDNITHNLNVMAEQAGIYKALWRPYQLHKDYVHTEDYKIEMAFEDSVTIIASDIISIIEQGLDLLKNRPDYFNKFDSPNGWGKYVNFVPFVENYLNALKQYPNSIVIVDR
jgi:hypothetical protein